MANLRASLPIQEVAARHEAGESLRSLASCYGVTVATLSRHLERSGSRVRTREEANSLRTKGKHLGGVVRNSPEWKKKMVDYQRVLRKKKIALVREHKQRHGCQVCGEHDWIVLDLHHKDPKTKDPRLSQRRFGKAMQRTGGDHWRNLSFVEIEAELEKCEVLCSNCHRRETHRQRIANMEESYVLDSD